MSAQLTNMKPCIQIVIKPRKHFKSQEHGHLLEGVLCIRGVRRCRQRAVMKARSTEVKNMGRATETEQVLKIHAYCYLIKTL